MRSLIAILILVLAPLHMAWAATNDCRDHQMLGASGVPASSFGFNEIVGSSSMEVQSVVLASVLTAAADLRLPANPFLPSQAVEDWDWEYFDDDAPDIVEKLSALDMRDIDLDRMSCSLTTHKSPVKAGALDPHEFDLPRPGLVHALTVSRRAVLSSQAPLIAAPVFRTYRPPMTTL